MIKIPARMRIPTLTFPLLPQAPLLEARDRAHLLKTGFNYSPQRANVPTYAQACC
ncbi:MAG: hypothetical protein ACUVRH_07015 [Candidatus Bipolaricaulia bacterium]